MVVIKAREDSWLSISVDGEIVTRALLAAGTQKSVRAEKEIAIKAGNVGALDFEFNGQKLPTQGDYGEVKTLTFDAHGMQASAASAGIACAVAAASRCKPYETAIGPSLRFDPCPTLKGELRQQSS